MPCSKSPYILLLVCFWLLQVLGPFVEFVVVLELVVGSDYL
jgi:hypothetical protein